MSLQTRLAALITAVGADIKQLKNGGGAPPLVSALPTVGPSGSGALVNGQDCALVIDASTIWHLIYKTSTGKWHYIGGPPLFAETNVTNTFTATTYTGTQPATPGPAITLPFAGDYDVELGMTSFNNTAGQDIFMSYDIGNIIGSTAALDAYALRSFSVGNNGVRSKRQTGLGAVTLNSKYRVTGGTGSVDRRWMKVTPVTLG